MERHTDYLYRIKRLQDGRWSVMAYLENTTDVVGPKAVFDDDALPDWIRKDIALLGMVDPMGEITSIGHRIGETFWLVSENSKHLVKRRTIVLAMAADQMDHHFGVDRER